MKHASVCFLVAGVLAFESLAAQNAENTVNSANSVLHGRTTKVADKILDALGPTITRYDQVTNLAQLSSINHLYLQNVGLTSLQAGDFEGLVNLITLWLEKTL